MKQTRRKHSAAFKAEVALAAIKERETLAQLSERYGINQVTISKWKTEFLKHSAEVFAKGATTTEESFEKERNELYAKIGELEMQRDWLKKSQNNCASCKRVAYADFQR